MYFTAYLAIHDFEAELEREFEVRGYKFAQKKDRIYLVEGDGPDMIWAQVTARKLQKIEITSINDGVRKLKELGRR